MGACLHNHEQEEGGARRGADAERDPFYGSALYMRKIRAYGRHRFCLVAENAIEPDCAQLLEIDGPRHDPTLIAVAHASKAIAAAAAQRQFRLWHSRLRACVRAIQM